MSTITKNRIERFLFNEGAIKNRRDHQNLLHFLHEKNWLKKPLEKSVTDSFATRAANDDKPLHEKLGPLVDIMTICESFDVGAHRHNRKAVTLDGSESNFNQATVQGHSSIGEMNASVVLGQNFDTVYPSSSVPLASGLYTTVQCSYLAKEIAVPHYFLDGIFVKSVTTVQLPADGEMVYYVDNGGTGIMAAEAFTGTSMTYQRDGRSPVSRGQRVRFLRAVRSDNEQVDEYTNYVQVENYIEIPFGVTHFTFNCSLSGQLYSSKDFSTPAELQEDAFSIALLDFRNKLFDRNLPIISDVMGAWNKQPFGGAQVCSRLEFYQLLNTSNP